MNTGVLSEGPAKSILQQIVNTNPNKTQLDEVALMK